MKDLDKQTKTAGEIAFTVEVLGMLIRRIDNEAQRTIVHKRNWHLNPNRFESIEGLMGARTIAVNWSDREPQKWAVTLQNRDVPPRRNGSLSTNVQ